MKKLLIFIALLFIITLSYIGYKNRNIVDTSHTNILKHSNLNPGDTGRIEPQKEIESTQINGMGNKNDKVQTKEVGIKGPIPKPPIIIPDKKYNQDKEDEDNKDFKPVTITDSKEIKEGHVDKGGPTYQKVEELQAVVDIMKHNDIKCELTNQGVTKCFASVMQKAKQVSTNSLTDGTYKWTFDIKNNCATRSDCKVNIQGEKINTTAIILVGKQGYIKIKYTPQANH